MTILIETTVLFILLGGFWLIVDWFWEVGVQEIVIYTEHFLLNEAKRVRLQKLPEVTSSKLWDRLELLLFYSGIRNKYPFVSGKIWLLWCVLLNGLGFVAVGIFTGSVWKAATACVLICIAMMAVLAWMRSRNLRSTEKHLLELVNLTESFAATGEESVAILMNCSSYMQGPIGQVLKNVEKARARGLSSRLLLEQMKVMLEHPKWQEFIHNLSVCSMYNSDFTTVFASSRKSIQGYLSSKKERDRVKQAAKLEMAIIVVFSFIIAALMGQMLEMSLKDLVWGNAISKGCTVYMICIILLFFGKLGTFEKE
ncbi:MAG: hypothetical protein IJZ84_02480 [Lachnospiraceae bacterium]|nr:hypothetical protein [Lachnospiraceae bacterium]